MTQFIPRLTHHAISKGLAFGLSLALSITPLSITSLSAQPIISGLERFHPVLAENGMVASQEALATEVGVEVLKQGGNAIDAAVAVGFALAVTLPRAGNIGGGGFMIVHKAEQNETVAIDYRERAPKSSDRDMFLDQDGNADPQKSRYSALGIGVPGTVAGLALAHKKYGSGNFTLAQLIEPARKLAENGFQVSVDLSSSLNRSTSRLTTDPETRAIFYDDAGIAPTVGSILKQADLAQSLAKIQENGPDAFYKGSIAERIASTIQDLGGRMTMEDLADYKALIRKPVTGSYRGYDIASMPPPSSGGTHIVQILNTIEPLDLGSMGHNSAETIHWLSEAMKRAYADRSQFLGDPDFVDVPVKQLTDKAYAQELLKTISGEKATPSKTVRPGTHLPVESNETTHFSVIDKDGNAVSNTYTLNFSYGVGVTAKGTGILLNNELDDFSAKAGVANAYGLIGGTANAVEGGKRPLSSMSPTMVFKNGKVLLVTGSPGGSRIITTTLQIILNVIDFNMNIAEASAAPRFHHQWLPDEIRIEKGFSVDTLRLLEQKGHVVTLKRAMGSTQSIMVLDEGLRAGASDPRRSDSLTSGY